MAAVPIRARRQTVNERIDSILDDSCRSSIIHPEDSNPLSSSESKRLSQLYEVSLDDKYLKQRVHVLPSPISRERQCAISRQKFSRERASLPLTASAANISPPKHRQLEQLPISPIKSSQSTPQIPTWYMGHNNVANGPTCSLQAKMKRYGARGTIQLAAVDTVAGTVPRLHGEPSKLLESKLDDLVKMQHPDTWSPTLHGSPTMWSEEAAFVQGAPLAFQNTRQPHVHHKAKSKMKEREVDEHAMKMNDKTKAELVELQEALTREQAQERGRYAASKEVLEAMLEKQWDNRSHHEHHSKVPAKTLKDMTLIKTIGPPRIAAISTKLANCKFELRWKTMFLLIDAMRRSVFNRPLLQELTLLLEKVVESGIRHQRTNPYELSRDQCRELFAKDYPAFGVANFNLMYSSFDPTHTDHLDMRDVVATIRALRISNANTRASSMKEVLLELIEMYANASFVHVYHIQRVFCLFCESTSDENGLILRLEAVFFAYRSFRKLHGTVTMEEVDAFLTEQTALVDLFTENLLSRRRHVNSISLNDNH